MRVSQNDFQGARVQLSCYGGHRRFQSGQQYRIVPLMSTTRPLPGVLTVHPRLGPFIVAIPSSFPLNDGPFFWRSLV